MAADEQDEPMTVTRGVRLPTAGIGVGAGRPAPGPRRQAAEVDSSPERLHEVVEVLERIESKLELTGKEVLTSLEAAELLGVSDKTLAGLGIRSVKLGRRTRRYLRADVLAYMKERAE
jgi:hypothetical protein